MGRDNGVIYNLLIILIATLCLDGGRSVLSAGIDNQPVIAQKHLNDIELPNHHNHSHFYDTEKLAGSPGIDFLDYSDIFVKFPADPDPMRSEFQNSIWQPPETI
jgi:hypothetical protein